MKIKGTETIAIPVPEQFRKDWQSIVYAWIDENNDEYPDAVIESVDPNIDYYKRYDGESLMEGEIEVTLGFYRDASSVELPLQKGSKTVKLKEFLENVVTTEVVVCIPPQIIAEKPELHNFVESLKDEYKIDTAMKLSCTLESWKDYIVAILTIDAHMYDVETLPLYSNQEALNVVLELEVDKITTHLAEYERAMINIILK